MNSITNTLNKRWADYESDSDDDIPIDYINEKISMENVVNDLAKYFNNFNVKIINKDNELPINKEEDIINSIKENNIKEDNIKEDNIKENIKEDIIKEDIIKEDMFKEKFKVISNKKNNIEIVFTLERFIELIKLNKKPNINFKIHKTAHCFHTFNGTMCFNVKKCNKIHIQRCMYNNKCNNKNCTFIHEKNMPDLETKNNFKKSMDNYNKIKNKKQVK